MKEHPIICRDDEVRAFLEGRKTQMRRPVKPIFSDAFPGTPLFKVDGGIHVPLNDALALTSAFPRHCPFGVVGDRLWVRECFTPNHGPDSTSPEHCIFRADDNRSIEDLSEVRWTPSGRMPRWASRITLAITSVRVEHLQDITEEDARAEGVHPQFVIDVTDFRSGKPVNPTHKIGFKHTWDDVYNDGPGRYNSANPQKPFAWINNPFVWALNVEVRDGR